VAPAADGLRNGTLDDRGKKWLRCAQIQANRAARGIENAFRVRMTGRLIPISWLARGPETLSAMRRYATVAVMLGDAAEQLSGQDMLAVRRAQAAVFTGARLNDVVGAVSGDDGGRAVVDQGDSPALHEFFSEPQPVAELLRIRAQAATGSVPAPAPAAAPLGSDQDAQLRELTRRAHADVKNLAEALRRAESEMRAGRGEG